MAKTRKEQVIDLIEMNSKPISMSDIREILQLNRVYLSKLIKSMVEDGLVTKQNGYVTIPGLTSIVKKNQVAMEDVVPFDDLPPTYRLALSFIPVDHAISVNILSQKLAKFRIVSSGVIERLIEMGIIEETVYGIRISPECVETHGNKDPNVSEDEIFRQTTDKVLVLEAPSLKQELGGEPYVNIIGKRYVSVGAILDILVRFGKTTTSAVAAAIGLSMNSTLAHIRYAESRGLIKRIIATGVIYLNEKYEDEEEFANIPEVQDFIRYKEMVSNEEPFRFA